MIALDIPPAVLPAEHHDRPGSGAFSYIARARARFWTGWSAATGETEVKPILKAAKKAQQAPGQTPQPPAPVEPREEQLTMEAMG